MCCVSMDQHVDVCLPSCFLVYECMIFGSMIQCVQPCMSICMHARTCVMMCFMLWQHAYLFCMYWYVCVHVCIFEQPADFQVERNLL